MKKAGIIASILAGAVLSLSRCGEEAFSIVSGLPETVDFNFHVKPILSDRCFACHGPDRNQRKAGLRLDTYEGLFEKKLASGGVAIKAGSLKRSEAYRRMIAHDPDLVMPPVESNLTLEEREIAVIGRWIEQGAVFKPHWAFIPPQKPQLPEVKEKNWCENPIDHFILSRLEGEGLGPNPAADKETLLRRVTFDLTGLPPSLEEIDAFLADGAPDAYEKVVDRLLASPAYGERMAIEWLDLARYADTHGYTVDRYRDMSPWRDWVIAAFNDNMPFDRFVTWQLAGDLLPDPTREQLIATAFNRNHPQNAEGGIVNEEFRVEYVADRTQTFGTAFLGLTLNCARCHDHKYDPVGQREFYSLYSFFNNVDESGQITWSDVDVSGPTILLTDDEVSEQLAFLEGQISGMEKKLLVREENDEAGFERWLEGRPEIRGAFPKGLIAFYPLEGVSKERVPNLLDPSLPGKVLDPVENTIAGEAPPAVEGHNGKGVLLNGDDALAFPAVGRFHRAQPFSIGLWVSIPAALNHGVIFHSNKGGIIYNFKGYQLSLESDRLDVRLAHVFPSNAIHLVAETPAPKDRWIHLMLTYDGSSRASGVKVYLDGEALKMAPVRDNLYKDIIFVRENVETYLKVGARWRSKGLAGGMADEIVVFDRQLTPPEVLWAAGKNPLPAWIGNAAGLTAVQREQLRGFYRANCDEAYRADQEALQTARSAYNALAEPVRELMVIREMPQPRPAFVLGRGQYDAPSEQVFPSTPDCVLPFPDDFPKNRLGLSRWLFHPENPLTSRVTVNRYWQSLFGKGIVATAEDFGNQGELPVHPELLDWLALSFRESGWDVKAMQKLMVMSASYRQSSGTTPELRERDPDNRLLARGPSQRLSAEMLRDNALAASGLLVRKTGGPSVKPYQPEGLWRFNSGRYDQGHGDDLYRRGLYTFLKRTVPPPAMNTFDAPDRSYCIARRQKTSTPLQALTLLNDPQFVEAARVLAQKTMMETASERERLVLMYRRLTGVRPDDGELDLLEALFRQMSAKFSAAPEKMEGWLRSGEYPLPDGLEPVALAAHAVAASTIMNYDACVMKR